jgi:Ser/Thr protein kinase RdoA (MazF antagonist)
MSPSDLELVARSVLEEEYGLPRLQFHALGNRGGFSGAALWRVKHSDGDLCLRTWPADDKGKMAPERLTKIHSLMKLARDKDLAFIPAVLPTRNGNSFVDQADRLWDLTTWMPGAAATPAQVTKAQVEAAFSALARLHTAWATADSRHGPCPGIHRRLDAFHEWQSHIRNALDSDRLAGLRRSPCNLPVSARSADPVEPYAQRAWQLLRVHACEIPAKLGPWLNRPMPLQPCLCDVWHDHVLFEGDTVTGLVDFGGVKTDHVAVDLARLLGSLVEDRVDLRAAGLEAYRRIRPLSLQEEELTSVLDESGTLVGLMTWLKWLYVDGKPFEDRASAARRLQALVEWIERLIKGKYTILTAL